MSCICRYRHRHHYHHHFCRNTNNLNYLFYFLFHSFFHFFFSSLSITIHLFMCRWDRLSIEGNNVHKKWTITPATNCRVVQIQYSPLFNLCCENWLPLLIFVYVWILLFFFSSFARIRWMNSAWHLYTLELHRTKLPRRKIHSFLNHCTHLFQQLFKLNSKRYIQVSIYLFFFYIWIHVVNCVTLDHNYNNTL